MALKSVCFFLFVLHGAFSEGFCSQMAKNGTLMDSSCLSTTMSQPFFSESKRAILFKLDALVHPCSKVDIACLSESSRDFLEKTSAGVKEYDIRPIDPWFSSEIKLPAADGVSVVLKNVSVVGLKLMKIDDFKIDLEKRSVVLGMKNNAVISSDIEVEKDGQMKSGTVSGQQYRVLTSKYSYELVPDEKGVEYFQVGPESLTCELEGKPNIKANDEVANLLWSDAATAEESKKKLICTIIETAYKDVMHNLRVSAKIYPKTAYFTDLD